MRMKQNLFNTNKPEPEMICTDPSGKKHELHDFRKGFGFNCCMNCGVNRPQ